MRGKGICPECDEDIEFNFFDLSQTEGEATCECGAKVKWTIKQPIEANCYSIDRSE